MSNKQLSSNFSTLALIILKENRIEKGIHQGYIAQQLGKSPSAWTKIENGQSQLSLDILMGACQALQILPSHVLDLVQRLSYSFNQRGYFFQYGIDSKEDDLLPKVIEYFNSDGYSKITRSTPSGETPQWVSVLSLVNAYFFYNIPSIVRYCTECNYKQWFDNGANGIAPSPEL